MGDGIDEPQDGQTVNPDDSDASESVSDIKCWEMRPNCMMKHQSREKANCPAYRERLGCWEVDWRGIVELLPSGHQEYWMSFLNNCENCVAYKAHPEEMQSRIDAVKALIFDD